MVRWLAATLLMSLVGLTLARFLDPPYWVDALLATMACAALSLGLLVALGIRRLAPRSWTSFAAALLALAAASGRASLLAEIAADPLTQRALDVVSLALAVGSVSWGALALLWGSSALADNLAAWEAHESEGEVKRPWLPTLLAAGAVALSLYSLAPIWQLLGLELNLWTLVGLFALALVAYGIASGYRWLRSL